MAVGGSSNHRQRIDQHHRDGASADEPALSGLGLLCQRGLHGASIRVLVAAPQPLDGRIDPPWVTPEGWQGFICGSAMGGGLLEFGKAP